jgi:hypothetical protein
MGYFYDVMASFLIFFVFGIIFLGLTLAAMAKDIERNWPKYRCNPAIMPFASFLGKDAVANFTECVGEIQNGFMGFFIGPIMYAMENLASIGGDLVNSLDSMRVMFNTLQNGLTSIFGDVMTKLSNVSVAFQLMLINIKDLFQKVAAVLINVMYIIHGTTLTFQSVDAGPIGDFMRMFGGDSGAKQESTGLPEDGMASNPDGETETLEEPECFSKHTPIKLLDGSYRKISHLREGDILTNGSKVNKVLKITGKRSNVFYKIYSEELNDFIYVTRSHLIKDKKTGDFIFVKNYNEAKVTDSWDKELFCLITSDNIIPIGEHIFWDCDVDAAKKQLAEEKACFKKTTKLKLQNGTYKNMSDLELGDILINGSEVKAILRIKGEKENKFYKIYSDDLKDYIYVTGTHLIKNPANGEFICVEDYSKSEKTETWDKELSCLVTSNNLISIGEHVFWDWED